MLIDGLDWKCICLSSRIMRRLRSMGIACGAFFFCPRFIRGLSAMESRVFWEVVTVIDQLIFNSNEVEVVIQLHSSAQVTNLYTS
jgi:hypothetical protein